MSGQNKIWWLLPLAGIIAGMAIGLLLWNFADMPSGLALKEGMVAAGVFCLTTTICLLLIQAYPTKVGIIGYAMVVGAIIGMLGAWVDGFLLRWILDIAQHESYSVWFHRSEALRWSVFISLYIIISMALAARRRMEEMEKRYNLQQDAGALLREAELFKLRQQLQPHFLYNSLNAISSLVLISPDRAQEMIGRLSDFLRTAVKQGRQQVVTLEEELEYLRSYLWIEAVRFGDRMQIEWSGEELAGNAQLPPFLLQPLVENAVKYGVYGNTGTITISINISMTSGILRISISNPFDASMKSATGTGFGLEGVRRRLYLVYARTDLLQTESADGHFTTTIQIPQ
jgi:sensor histidine kinase YesM